MTDPYYFWLAGLLMGSVITQAGAYMYRWYLDRQERRNYRATFTMVETPKLNQLLTKIPSDWNREDFVICGSAALAFRGIRDVHDLDILVTPELMERLNQTASFDADGYAESFAFKLKNIEIDVFDKSPRIDVPFKEIKARADRYSGFYVQSPQHTLAIKALVPDLRAKDLPDMLSLAKILKNYKSPRARDSYRYF